MFLFKKVFVAIIFVGVLFFSGQSFVSAQANAGVPVNYEGTIFGGIITGLIPCTCSNNYLIYVVDLVSKSVKSILVWPPYSKLYLFYTFNPGQWVLGTYTAGPVCEVVTTYGCDTIPTDGAINSGPGAGSSGLYPVSGL